MRKNTFLLFYFAVIITNAHIILEANGSGNTYEFINSVLTNTNPNTNVVEVVDYKPNDFLRHINEVFEDEFNKNVFQFHIHVSPDNDKCKEGVNGRQRNRIKPKDETYTCIYDF